MNLGFSVIFKLVLKLTIFRFQLFVHGKHPIRKYQKETGCAYKNKMLALIRILILGYLTSPVFFSNFSSETLYPNHTGRNKKGHMNKNSLQLHL